ncbi:hypothetical protein [Staphylococcus aureus]
MPTTFGGEPFLKVYTSSSKLFKNN